MSQQEPAPYEFGDDLPLESVLPGTTLLVAGPALSRAHALGLELVLAGPSTEGHILLATEGNSRDFLEQCRDLNAGVDYDRVCLVDATGTDAGDLGPRVEAVDSASDLTEIGLGFSSFYEDLYREGRDRVRTGVFSASALVAATDLRTTFRFLNTVAGRVSSADGLGVFVVHPEEHDEEAVGTLAQVTDARIDVRGEGDDLDELRVDGLDDQPSGWAEF